MRLLSILAVAAAVTACGSGDQDFRIIETIELPDGPIVLEFAPSQLAFGSADIRVRSTSRGSDVVIYEGRISNDGSDITLENLRPEAGTPGYLWLCLNGVEQKDVSVRIELQTGLVIAEERHCSD